MKYFLCGFALLLLFAVTLSGPVLATDAAAPAPEVTAEPAAPAPAGAEPTAETSDEPVDEAAAPAEPAPSEAAPVEAAPGESDPADPVTVPQVPVLSGEEKPVAEMSPAEIAKKKRREERELKALYPYPTPIIKTGEDIVVCPDAKKAEFYTGGKKSYKFIHHGKNGWLFRSVDFRTDYDLSPQSEAYFKRLNDTLKAKDQTLIILYQPPRALLSTAHIDPADVPAGYDPAKARANVQGFLNKLENLGIMTVDLTDAPAQPDYFYPADLHWSYEGAKWSAERIADKIKELSVYDDIPKGEYISEVIDQGVPDRGGMEDVIQSICQVNIEAVSRPVWATSPKADEDVQADSLLGDVVFPSIAVVGTSNTALDYRMNFIGSLKHALKADVYNAAIMGGGFGSSSFRYYASDEYHDYPPKVIVWEFLPQHNHNGEDTSKSFRQMIPAIYGACKPEDALATYEGEITQLEFDILADMKNKPLKDTYIYMEVHNPEERNLKLEILYADGEADDVNLTRNTRIANNGKYYFEPSDRKPLFFHVVTDKAEGQISARICSYPAKPEMAEKK